MVGAQNAIKSASNFLPWRNMISETIIIEKTTRSIIKVMTPIFFINLLIMVGLYSYLKLGNYKEDSYIILRFY